MGTKSTRSRALASHVRRIYNTFSVTCPFSAAVVKIPAVCDIVVCLAVTPLLVSVIITGGCTPYLVVFTASARAVREFHTIENKREHARCMVIVP